MTYIPRLNSGVEATSIGANDLIIVEQGAPGVTKAARAALLWSDSTLDLTIVPPTTGTTDWSPIFQEAAETVQDPSSRFYRKTIVAPGGDYPVLSTMLLNLADGLEIHLAHNARVVADAGLQGKIFQFTNSSRVKFSGGIIDASLMGNPAPGQAWDSLSFERNGSPAYTVDITVKNVTFVHSTGDTPGAPGNAGGDSSIFGATTRGMSIRNCRFYGSPDAAIYLSGDGVAANDSAFDFLVHGNRFYGCYSACEAKRTAENIVFMGNIVRNGGAGGGFATTPGGPSGAALLPGKKVIVADNQFINTQGFPVSLRGFTDSIVQANRIEGFTDVATFIQQGIVVAGSKRNKIRGNSINAPSGGTGHATQVGIMLTTYVLDGVSTHSTENEISGNSVTGLEYGIVEASANQTGNVYRGNTVRDCTTPYSILGAGSSLALPVAEGGTGATTAAAARTALATGGLADVNVWTGPNSFNERIAAGTYIRPGFDTVTNIQAVATPGVGARMTATDSTVTAAGNYGAAVVGGGGNEVPVWFDFNTTTWRIG